MNGVLAARLRDAAEQVEAELDRLLPAAELEPAVIQEAMRYSVCGGGKRLRAALVLLAAGLRGGPPQPALPVAAALEMIHAYSLVHDDLPCMDDDDYRRGKLANHKVFGEGLAVLAGDGLLTQAFAVLADLPRLSGLSAATSLQIIREIAGAAGTAGLIGGQVADLSWAGRMPTPEEVAAQLVFIHSRKTGALFQAALRAGALVGGLPGPDLAAVDGYARHFGLAFQIADDILDVAGDSAVLGKPAGSDARQQKLTYPRAFGLAAARRMAEEAATAAVAALADFGVYADPLQQLARFVVDRAKAGE